VSERNTDFMVPYEGNTDAKPIDYYMYGSHLDGGENIGGLVTFGNQMLVRFYSDYAINYAGLDLTATVIDPITKYVKGYGSDTDNGPWGFIAAPMKYYAMPENVTNLFPVENEVTNTASADYDLYRYNQSAAAEWENYKAHKSGFTLNDGQGYLYANRYTKTLQFAGAVNIDESKDVALAYDANANLPGWNLVGNPLMANAYVNKPYYVINDIGNDIEPVDNYLTWPVPMCTGILVCADGEDETVRFSKTAQSRSTDNGGITMTLTKASRGSASEYQDKAIVSFNEDAKLGKFIFNEDNAKLYIPQDDKDYAIAYAKREGEVPVSFKTKETGKYTITVETCHGASLQGVRLIDKFENVTIDLGADAARHVPTYTFTASAADKKDRFVLVFDSPSTGSGTEVFAYQNGDQIMVSGDGELQVFDVLGRQVATQHINGVETMSASSLQTGVYILRLVGNEIRTQKIVVR
ncbi:MAG: T9SS type A sorting domain-containing protein, partial [Bacteroidales bacterium]|nr:T9SS type A sorting domain-containing protein [Bacteroidales bacterium]